MLYESSTLRFLSTDEPWGDLRDLIFGSTDICTDPFFNEDIRRKGEARLAVLRELWNELRVDILKAHKRYRPGTLPWAAKMFDKPGSAKSPGNEGARV
jgi:hypothetical protein